LAKRAQQHWDSGLFSDCHYHSKQLVQAKATELLYTIKVDGDKLTPPHQQGESHDFLMWRVNRLLPGDGKGCGTAVGVGQKSDTYGKSKHKVMITPGGLATCSVETAKHRCFATELLSQTLVEYSNSCKSVTLTTNTTAMPHRPSRGVTNQLALPTAYIRAGK
ncbi:hypothetical protein T265_15768, partial [Opisthorchis viverrini]